VLTVSGWQSEERQLDKAVDSDKAGFLAILEPVSLIRLQSFVNWEHSRRHHTAYAAARPLGLASPSSYDAGGST